MCKVSVIVPTYKRYDLLTRCLDSILNQTYKNIEIIVVDDNPPDSNERTATRSLMERYQQSHPFIKYLQNSKNMGGSLTRNRGIMAAEGEYLTFLDDDDEYLPDKIEVELKAMLENNWDVCVMDAATYSQEDGHLISRKEQKVRNGMTNEELMKIHLLFHITNVNTFMYRTKKIQEINGFDDIPACQEYVLMQKTLEARMSLGYIPQIHVKCYIGKGERVSTNIKKVKAQKYLISQKKRYFNLLTLSERRTVLCRNYGVLMNIYLKNNRYLKAIMYLIMAAITSPVNAFKWFVEYRKKIGA